MDLFPGLYNTQINPLQMLSLVSLADKAKTKVKELSGGRRQRFSTGLDLQVRRSLRYKAKLAQRFRSTSATKKILPQTTSKSLGVAHCKAAAIASLTCSCVVPRICFFVANAANTVAGMALGR